MAEISVAVLRNIRKAVKAGKKTKKEIAEKYGVSVSTVSRIAKMTDKQFEAYLERKKGKRTAKKTSKKSSKKKTTRKCASRKKR